MLEVIGLRAWYGRTQALFDVSLSLPDGQCLALVGTNGAGKTTIIRAILGLIGAEGEIRIDGEQLLRHRTPRRVRRYRISVVHEGRGLLPRMTVTENILVGQGAAGRRRLDKALDLFPMLRARLQEPVSLLSGGQQQMVSLARVVVQDPRLLLLDEPALGLAPIMVDEIYEYLRRLRDGGLTMLLVEQNISRASAFASSLCLIRSGRSVMTAEGGNAHAAAELVRIAFAETSDLPVRDPIPGATP
jgi:branched-chain amino acid transport system ATP-binding protein